MTSPDARVGLVIDLLKSKGMYDDSAIFFSADNGGPIYGDGSAGANNFPLKGGKVSAGHAACGMRHRHVA